jgi:pyruvate,water dikinase
MKEYDDLVRVSEEIRLMVFNSPIPLDLEQAIEVSFAQLRQKTSTDRFALRSSALGEDTQFSFAGQYASHLNVKKEELMDRYREVVAGKFTPQAIYYFLSHSMTESDLAMSVGCVEMIDSRASGVIYTRDPIHPEDDSLVIHSVFGLGKYLVDGTLTPDVFRVSRRDKALLKSEIVSKPVRLVMRPEGGTNEEAVPVEEQKTASISEDDIFILAEFASYLEEHYGSPQDIEWAIDHEGKPYILQSRPLRVMGVGRVEALPDLSQLERLTSSGTTACPGAGSGPVFQAQSLRDLSQVPEGAVLAAPRPFPGLITAMGRIAAIVTRVGGVASHMATLAREYRVPTLVGVDNITDIPIGKPVTVDATGEAVYAGVHQEIVDARRPEHSLFGDLPIFELLEGVLEKVSPLNLLHPGDPDFTMESCLTLHDVTRFAHQKATEAMFSSASGMEGVDLISFRLRSDIPLQVNVIYIDREVHAEEDSRFITVDEIESEPMTSFWNGVLKEGWPSQRVKANFKGVPAKMMTTDGHANTTEYREQSLAVIGNEYFLCNVQMGFHLARIEAVCSGEPGKNYIRMQFRGGGTTRERRTRRVKLISDILSSIGFENESRGDFLDTKLSYETRQRILETLYVLGRLTILAKQLDMALTNDKISQWYTQDIAKKLGIDVGGAVTL